MAGNDLPRDHPAILALLELLYTLEDSQADAVAEQKAAMQARRYVSPAGVIGSSEFWYIA